MKLQSMQIFYKSHLAVQFIMYVIFLLPTSMAYFKAPQTAMETMILLEKKMSQLCLYSFTKFPLENLVQINLYSLEL
jgi:hypothetical protein